MSDPIVTYDLLEQLVRKREATLVVNRLRHREYD